MDCDNRDMNERPRKRILATTIAVVAALAAFAAYRLWPRPMPPATPAMRTAAVRLAASRAAPARPPRPPAHPRTDRERLMAAAYALRGKPYRWGAKGPAAYDCSGFTKAAYATVGVRLPDGSFNQASGEKPLASPRQLAPGDLLLYRWTGERIAHVTMWVGDGWAIGTGSPGQPKEVVVFPLASDLRHKGLVLTYRHIALRDER